MIRRFYNPRNEDCFRLSGEFIKERVCEKSYKVHKYVSGKSLRHGMLIEIIWTIIPSLILLLIAIPSFSLLYAIDEAYTMR